MSVSPMHHSTGAISSKQLKRKGVSVTSKDSKAKKLSTWEMKRRLVKQRLIGLGCTDKNEESSNMETAIVVHPPQESPTNDANSSVGVSNSPMERAEGLRENLSPRFPTLVKLMLKSHVSGCFWLGLPKKFCVAYLPENDEIIALIGDNEDEYDTKYLADKCGLSGGWRAFSIAHKLLDEDVLVFQLIEPCKFKVHIVRARSFAEIDGATSHQNLDFHAEPKIIEVKMEEGRALITEIASDNCLEVVPAPAENNQNEDMGGLVHPSDSSSETMDGITFSEAVVTFKDVKCFEDFHIHVDGLMIDAEIPLHLRTKYYELCLSQKTFLHENLMQGLNTKLAAGMISETINIADAIRAANSSTDVSHLQGWDRTLKAFEDLGMVVGFLRARIDKLLTLYRQVQARIELKRTERTEAIEEMRSLVVKLSDVKNMIENLNAEIDGLVEKNEEVMYNFREVAAAPW